jgi:streptogramin lyase
MQAVSGLITARARRRSAARVRARPRLEGLEDRCLLSPTITEFPVPNAYPQGITAGPDGNLWFMDANNIGEASNIGMINPATHAIAEFPIPTANADPRMITAGPDGNLWFTEFFGGIKGSPWVSKIGMINPATHAIAEFSTPTANAGPYGISAGPDGNLWFTEFLANKIGMINPATHAIGEFPIPSASPRPQGISAGPDGNLWFAQQSAGAIGMINPATHAITEFTTAPYGSSWISAGADGNLWFTEGGPSNVGMINPATHASAEFATPTASASPDGISAGPDGNLWFTERAAGNIGMINPATHGIFEYPVPYAGSTPYQITAGPDGNLWFTDRGTNAIGVLTVPTTQLVVTQQPPASVTAGSPFGFTVTAEDASGHVVSSFNGTVTVGLANNPGGATLGGTLTATASNGVATFSGLTLNKAASGYTLAASVGGLGDGVTGTFTVTPAAATQLAITQQPPATVSSNTPFGLVAVVEDQFGNVVTSASNDVTVALAANPGGATLGGATTVVAVDGVVTFSNLTLNKRGTGYTLKLSSAGLTAVTSGPITVK